MNKLQNQSLTPENPCTLMNKLQNQSLTPENPCKLVSLHCIPRQVGLSDVSLMMLCKTLLTFKTAIAIIIVHNLTQVCMTAKLVNS